MSWSYEKLWIILIHKKMKKVELRQAAGLTPTCLAKMGRDEPVTMVALGKICQALNCKIEDIVEYIPDEP